MHLSQVVVGTVIYSVVSGDGLLTLLPIIGLLFEFVGFLL